MSKIDVKYIDTRKYIAYATPDDFGCDSPDTFGNYEIELFGRYGNVDVDNYTDENSELLKEYQDELKSGKRFWIDRYEHSGVSYTLSGEGMNCRWDTSGKCGFIVFDDDYIKGIPFEQRQEYARQDLKEYTQWCNGEIYHVDIKTDTGLEIDSCGGYYGYEGIQAFIDEVLGNNATCEIEYV